MTNLNCDVELRDLLLEYKVYDSWQFVTNSIKNLETAEYCSDLIRRLLNAMDEEQEQKNEEMWNKLEEEGEYSFNIDDFPKWEVDILGKSVSYYFLLDKYIKDFFQYLRNSLDSIAQFINLTLLAENPMDIERVDFPRVLTKLIKQPNFVAVKTEMDFIKSSVEYAYISEFNNKVKHISDAKLVISRGILDNSGKNLISSFVKKGEPFKEQDINTIVAQTYSFIESHLDLLIGNVKNEISNLAMRDRRYHQIKFEGQRINGDAQNTFTNIFIECADNDKLADEIGILFVNDVDKDNIRVMNCEYDEIFVKDEEGKYVGKYKALESYDGYIDLLQYRRYKKEIFNSPCAFVIHDIKVNSIKPFFMSGTMKQIGFDDGSF